MGRGRRAEANGPRAVAVVGVGASAGGLAALEKLFPPFPADAGLAFVVVQHLKPDHPSMLGELVGRHTAMPVTEAVDGAAPAPGRVYVIAPGTLLTLEGGAFRVSAAPDATARGSIDAFLHSLADDRAERAIGVVLSGSGHDGTAGLRAIKERGGLTLAQDPDTARHDDMPRSAIEAGVVDHVLAPEEMAARILEHVGHVASGEAPGAAAIDAELRGRLRELCAAIRRHTGHDFTSYKEGTLLRRIRRRLQILRVGAVGEYLGLLERDPVEAQALVKDLLVGVTQFFRDPDAFRALAREVVPRVVQARPPDVPVRVWVPGCASGEEAYSIAMLLREHLDRVGTGRPVQIFATDLDSEMLAAARQGRYPASIAEHVGAERLARFFTRDRESYEVSKDLRETCIFSQHSLVRDPPFSQLDLVSCRNVLIYLGAELQRKLVPLFHYALRPGGFLFLGPSEGIAGTAALFETVDERHRIFRRRETAARPAVDFPLEPRSAAPAATFLPPPPAPPRDPPSPRELLAASFERLVLEEYAHPCAVVDEHGEIALVAGPLARFLHLPAGTLTQNLLEAVSGRLRIELRAALQASSHGGRRVVRERVLVEVEDRPRQLRLVVRPMRGAEQGPPLFLVVLQERSPAEDGAGEAAAAAADPPVETVAVEQLEDELRATRAELRATVEALEATNEELKSSNEELISTNEELQSANEELQTSKEELQSLNEELETVNTELRLKVDELATANGDLQNLFASTEIATLFLDRDLRIARFTPAATALLRLREGDVGRPVDDLAPRFAGQDLGAVAREVLRTLVPVERQVRATDGGRWSILRVLPYRTVGNLVAGVVVTLVDVTEVKRAEEALRASEERFRLLLEAVREYAIFMLAPDGTVVSWNSGAERLKGYRADEVIGQHFARFYPEEEVRAGTPQRLLELAAARGSSEHEGWRVRKDGSRFWASVLLTAVRDESGRLRGFAKVTRDVTERKRAELERERLAEQRQLALNAARMGWWHYDPATRTAHYDERYVEIFGVSGRERANDEILKLLHPQDLPRVWAAVEAALDPVRPRPYSAEYRIIRPDGQLRWVEARGLATFEGEGAARRATSLVGTVADVTDRKRAVDALRESEERLRMFVEHAPAAVAMFDRELRYVATSRRYLSDYGIPPGEVIGRSHSEVLPGVAARWSEIHRRCLAGAVEKREEDPLPRADGTLDWVRWEVHPWRTASGEIGGTVLFSELVTERKRAQDALRESEERLRRAQEIAHLGSWELDLERNRLYWSDEVYRIFGLVPQEFGASYEAFLAAVHPDDRAAVDAAYSGSLREGRDRYEIVHRVVRRATGEVRIVHEKCEHVRDERGRVIRSAGMVHDVTEHKRAEEALERSRQGLSRLAEASLSVMARTDLDGMLQAIAEAALSLSSARMATCGHGLVGGQLVVGGSARVPGAPACPPGDMFQLDKGGVHMALMEGADAIRLDDEALRAHARWWGLPDGHVPMRGLLGVPMRSRSGRPSGMILVTDREHGEFTADDESLLQQLATVASLALQHVEARISLEAADRHKNEFLAMLSHELRNPLAPIRNSLHVLERAAPGGEQARRAQAVIGRQVGHMTRLVDELLDVTRISRGKIQLRRETLDLADVVRRTVEDHRLGFVTSGLALEVTVPERPLPVFGDKTRLAQVLDNLLQNAAKFTPEGGKVTVSVEESAPLRQAVVRVRDTGAGIGRDMLPRLFEPFTQADVTLDRSQGGLGLGLALVKGLVEMHGGSVSVESDGPGRGAEFTLRLPLLRGPAPARAPSLPRPHEEGHARRVLVIEDNTDAAESLREVLELVGHAVEVAHSGPAGVEKARAFGPDVVLCDIGLPGLDGYGVARRLREDPALRSVMLVALTGYAGPDDVSRSREAGFDHHLAKPPTLEQLARVLDGVDSGAT